MTKKKYSKIRFFSQNLYFSDTGCRKTPIDVAENISGHNSKLEIKIRHKIMSTESFIQNWLRIE